jgi:penicillin-binding protein 1B
MTNRKTPARPAPAHKRQPAGYSSGPNPLLGLLRSPVFLALVVILGLTAGGVLSYYYFRYTRLIDAGLRGDIFVRSSGIYAAPTRIWTGSPIKEADLIAQLKRIGYQDQAGADKRRGVFTPRGAVLEIHPGSDAMSDGTRPFHDLRVSFGKNGDGIQGITDLSSREGVKDAVLEPELISSVLNAERQKRKIIDYKDLPANLVQAIVAIEDRQFFEHYGINWRGIIRALVRDYQTGAMREGGSSITQQLVKNFFLTPEKTPKRKLAEAYISVLLEQRLSKEQIMAMYCNQIYLGQRGGFSINGFGEAARAYFDKDVSHLTLPEAAMLAGIIRSPNRYSPWTHPDRAQERRNLVLDKLVEAGQITRDAADKAEAAPLGVVKSGGMDVSDAPYFIDYLTRQIEQQYDDRAGALRSLRIYSTLDIGLQRAAYQAVSKQMAALDKMFAKRKGGAAGLQAALVAMNAKTGEVMAMVGGRDYAASQLNRATEARRQPGSVFKPFVYAAALSTAYDDPAMVITPATLFMDAPRKFDYGSGRSYDPGNFGDKYDRVNLTVRDALVHSKNVITVEIAERVGFNLVARLAANAGLPKPPIYPSMALGVGEATPLQVASAYTIFANRGMHLTPVSLSRVTAATGSTILTSKPEMNRVISPQVAYIMTSMMQDVINRGTGSRVRQMGFKGTAAGKTGSSRDAWFAGYTPNLICVVWVGFDDNHDIGLTGGIAAAPIWADFMAKALQRHPELAGDFDDPGDLAAVDIDPATGLVAQMGGNNIRHEFFIKGSEPTMTAPALPGSEPGQALPLPPAKATPPETPAGQNDSPGVAMSHSPADRPRVVTTPRPAQ